MLRPPSTLAWQGPDVAKPGVATDKPHCHVTRSINGIADIGHKSPVLCSVNHSYNLPISDSVHDCLHWSNYEHINPLSFYEGLSNK